jgi:hypothetical protein
MIRKPGSGLVNNTTDAAEKLFAEVLSGNEQEALRCVTLIDQQFEQGKSGLSGQQVLEAFQALTPYFDFEVISSEPKPADRGGDVKSLSEDGPLWFELKMQTMKESFRDLTQADYVRDGTDFLRLLVQTDSEAAGYLTPETKHELDVERDIASDEWDLTWLHASDLCLLPDAASRRRVKVETPEELLAFANRKRLVHLTQEGIRMVKISELAPFEELAHGGQLYYELKTSNSNDVSIPMTVEDSLVDFTYHLGYKNAPGRHKLHARAVERSEQAIVILI